jgi:hypothetical protein
MLTLDFARQLKGAGLVWEPAQGDRFAVPDRGMDGLVFVINDMATMIENLQGIPAVTFHGTPEWALDYIHLGETIWLPDEGQLRQAVESRLNALGVTAYDLFCLGGTYSCRFELHGEAQAFHAERAEDAYAAALLMLLAAQ